MYDLFVPRRVEPIDALFNTRFSPKHKRVETCIDCNKDYQISAYTVVSKDGFICQSCASKRRKERISNERL